MNAGPARGLPPRIYLPILLVAMVAFLGVVGYFLKIGLGVTGSALGPEASVPGEGQSTASGVGGGTPPQVQTGGPPPPVQRLLVELRGRIARDPRDAAALAGLASLYVDAGKYEQAEGYVQRALAVQPKNAEALADRATISRNSAVR